jgi:hypothetical protein
MNFSITVASLGITDNILVGKPEGERPLGRYRHKWEDNIRMNLTEIGSEVVN